MDRVGPTRPTRPRPPTKAPQSTIRALAYDLFQEAYERHMEGELDLAVDLYRRSIETYPTAEAHTFLGWIYSFEGRLDEAIEIDPEFGNP